MSSNETSWVGLAAYRLKLRARTWLRGRLDAGASTSSHVRVRADAPATMDEASNPLAFVKPETMAEISSHLGNPKVLLQMQFARQVVARDRAAHFLKAKEAARVENETSLVASNTLEYNLEGARTAAMLDRPMVMANVVSSLSRVQQRIGQLDVLSIGPRSEIEIFGLIGAGFSPERIRAVDLFSYSPLVEVGDMHRLPYADNSFDALFVGWVLSYSRDQTVVARELIRVARDRAVVALAGDYSDQSRDRPTFGNETTHMQSCEQVLALFGDSVGTVWFRHDPELPDVAMVMTVFEIRKPTEAHHVVG
jgi:methyltransferase family protein